jgi:hypothetical protein
LVWPVSVVFGKGFQKLLVELPRFPWSIRDLREPMKARCAASVDERIVVVLNLLIIVNVGKVSSDSGE